MVQQGPLLGINRAPFGLHDYIYLKNYSNFDSYVYNVAAAVVELISIETYEVTINGHLRFLMDARY